MSRAVTYRSDKYVIWTVLALGAIGVFAVYSAVSFLAETKAGGDTERFLLRHLVRLALALGVMVAVSFVDYRKLARFSKYALIGSLGLLVLVQLVGVASGGAARWLRIGAFGFQPSDLARVALVLYVATLLASKQLYIKDFSRGFAPLLFWMLLTAVMIGIEDLSTSAVMLVAIGAMCFVGRVSTWQLAVIVLAGATLGYVLLLSSPARAARLEAYLGLKLFPTTEYEEVFSEQAEGYQAHQAQIAFAMGGLTGVGPGKSIQRDFLPAPYNDFIFAIIAEEYGVLGALALLALLAFLLFRSLLRVARHAPDPLGLFLAVGLSVMIALYGFVHAGVTSGLLPVTGLPMPFVSYGGTSMMANGLMMGMLLNISRQVHA